MRPRSDPQWLLAPGDFDDVAIQVPTVFLDVSADSWIDPRDVLAVINYINSHPGVGGEGEPADSILATIELPAPSGLACASGESAESPQVGAGVLPSALTVVADPRTRALGSGRRAEAPLGPPPDVRPLRSAQFLDSKVRETSLRRARRGADSDSTAIPDMGCNLWALDDILGEIAEDVTCVWVAARGQK